MKGTLRNDTSARPGLAGERKQAGAWGAADPSWRRGPG